MIVDLMIYCSFFRMGIRYVNIIGRERPVNKPWIYFLFGLIMAFRIEYHLAGLISVLQHKICPMYRAIHPYVLRIEAFRFIKFAFLIGIVRFLAKTHRDGVEEEDSDEEETQKDLNVSNTVSEIPK